MLSRLQQQSALQAKKLGTRKPGEDRLLQAIYHHHGIDQKSTLVKTNLWLVAGVMVEKIPLGGLMMPANSVHYGAESHRSGQRCQ